MISVTSCTVSPSVIELGGQANLVVTISSPAPPGGVSAVIDTDSDGSGDTLMNTPVALDFPAGQSEFTYLIQTQVVENAASKIIFSAHIDPGPAKAAQLTIT